MKKITLLVAAVLLLSVSAKAAVDFKFFDKPHFPIAICDAEPISFVERGIAFYVFPDGQFDFNTTPSRGEIYYKNGRRNANSNQTFGAAGNNFGGGIRIEHDNSGRIRRIGNVFINYDFNDRIKRIGSVYMSYNRFALAQVGGLRIIYNRFGQVVDFIGSVKGRWDYYNENDNCNNTGYGQSNGHFSNTFDNDSNNNDDQGQQNTDTYYYKKNKEKLEEDSKTPENEIKIRTGRR